MFALGQRIPRRTALAAMGFVVVLLAVAYPVHLFTDRVMRDQMADALSTMLEADVEALLYWLETQQAAAASATGDPETAAALRALIAVGRTTSDSATLADHPAATELKQRLAPIVEAFGFLAFYVTDHEGRTLASSYDLFLGEPAAPAITPYIQQVISGETGVTRPIVLDTPADTLHGRDEYNDRAGRPIMFVGAPIRDPGGLPVGILAFGIAPEARFSEILSVARFGATGDAYAFDSSGVMLSMSRFDSSLVALGLLPDDPLVTSVLNVQLRDPGGDLTRGFPVPRSLRGLPLTAMAANAPSQVYDPEAPDRGIGVDTDGYRDYRGRTVVGAWTWLPEYGFGVAIELERADAMRAQSIIRQVLWGIFGAFLIAAVAALVSNLVNVHLRSRMSEAERVGQYQLEKKIGAGGMGQVFRARHVLLRRPTAVKLLRTDRTNHETIRRFEREVRHTSKLTHPNTVAIYDYGRTPQGVFYYAMEYLPGVTLQQLVDEEGALPEGRVVHLLRQAAGSLAEAHEEGLVHRDVKPGNIMLCERGGLFDFVKVLDFGLVRQAEHTDETLAMTNPDAITGTPLYISPEAIRDPTAIDGRADLYALGAVAYFMLTGRHVFGGGTAIEVLHHHLNSTPDTVASRRDQPVHAELESLVMSLLSKDPDDRPGSARLVANLLDALSETLTWTQSDARAWWEAHARRRSSRDSWHVDFVSSEPTPDTGERGVGATLVVDRDRQGDTSTPESDRESG